MLWSSFIHQWLYSPLLGLLGPGLFFRFVILDGGSARRKAATYTQDNTNTEQTHTQISMPWVEFELMIPAFERAKTVHAFDRAVTVIGYDVILAANIRRYHKWSRDSVVGIATSYGMDDREVGVRVPVWSRIFFSPSRPDRLWRLWGPPNLLYNGYRGKAAGAWSWPFTSNKCRGQENVALYSHSCIRLHGVVIN
jgi:hypothetical protein